MNPVDYRVDGLDGHAAFLALHSHAGNVPTDAKGVARAPVAEALTALIENEDVPASARLEVLSELAKAGLPDFKAATDQYIQLAEVIAADGDTTGEELLADLKADAAGGPSFMESASAAALPHHVTAFFGEDICHTFKVNVDGKKAVWLFSEFETDAPFDRVADWVDPHNWPKRGPMVFKSMKPVAGGVTQIPGVVPGEAWHGEFHEVVQLVKKLSTQLHCDYNRVDGLFAGSTYRLTTSLDGEIDVDRGFLLVNDLGQTRNVKCLKVVGFTNDYWDEQANQWACLTWTHFVRAAVEGGTHSEPADPKRPPGSYTLSDAVGDFVECMGEASARYLGMGVKWAERVRQGYDLETAVRDTAGLWLTIAQDWSNATAEAFANLRRMAAAPDNGSPGAALMANWFSPGTLPQQQPAAGGSRAGAAVIEEKVVRQGFTAGTPGFEGATLAIPGLEANDTLSCGDLVRVSATKDTIAAADVRLSTVDVGGGWFGIHAEFPVSGAKPGLYIGEVTIAGKASRPVQIYVSKATGSSAGA